MALTPAPTAPQKAALKADILADPALAAFVAVQNWDAVAAAYNVVLPAVILWKSVVSQPDIYTQAAFDWTRVDNLSVGKARIWEWMFDNTSKIINPGLANIRAGIDAVWVGTAADLAVRA